MINVPKTKKQRNRDFAGNIVGNIAQISLYKSKFIGLGLTMVLRSKALLP
jgi:hypothetical protein